MKDLIRLLLTGEFDSSKLPYPPLNLQSWELRVSAAIELGKQYGDNPMVIAALSYVAFQANDDDAVRVECVRQLLSRFGSGCELVLLALLLDPDEEMRLTGLEGLAIIESKSRYAAAEQLANDSSDLVRVLAQQITFGHPFNIYKL